MHCTDGALVLSNFTEYMIRVRGNVSRPSTPSARFCTALLPLPRLYHTRPAYQPLYLLLTVPTRTRCHSQIACKSYLSHGNPLLNSHTQSKAGKSNVKNHSYRAKRVNVLRMRFFGTGKRSRVSYFLVFQGSLTLPIASAEEFPFVNVKRNAV